MKLTTCTALVILLGTSYAFAGAGAPVPPKEEGGPSSGRPGAVLDDAKCEAVWSKTQRQGDVLTADQAAPFIVNFKMVDVDGDGKITADEFKKGCKLGMVQEQPSKPAESGGGQTPQHPTTPKN